MGSDISSTRYISRNSHFNPRSPHGERLHCIQNLRSALCISIHAPRMGSDYKAHGQVRAHRRNFNPRSPHGERLSNSKNSLTQIIFQSTLPAWGATIPPHAPRANKGISIHAPRMGSDELFPVLPQEAVRFQSTLPAWGATSFEGT